MKKTFSPALLSLLVMYSAASAGFGQSVDDIRAKMIQARGGRKALEAVKDMTLTGTMEETSAGMSAPLTIYLKEPNKLRMDSEILGVPMTMAFDGETAWQTIPLSKGSQMQSENEAREIGRDGLNMGFSALLDPGKFGLKYDLKGKEKLENKDCFVLEVTFPDGWKMTKFVDATTYLVCKDKSIDVRKDGRKITNETVIPDYLKINGVAVPKSFIESTNGRQALRMDFERVSINAGLADDLFKMK